MHLVVRINSCIELMGGDRVTLWKESCLRQSKIETISFITIPLTSMRNKMQMTGYLTLLYLGVL